VPLLLNRAELAPLVDDPERIEEMIQATQAMLTACHEGVPSGVSFTGLALEGGNSLASFACSVPGRAVTVRLFPSPANRGDASDAWLWMLLDSGSGALKAILAGDDLNPFRTAAPAAMGARHLAPDGARVLAILGSGQQARAHARTFARALPDLERIQVWSPTPANRERFASETARALGLPVAAADHPAGALEGADVVTATGATKPGEVAAEAGWVRPGALFVSMTMAAPPELLAAGRRYVPTLTRPEFLAASFPQRPGLPARMPAFDPADTRELATVVLGRRPARESADETLVYLWDPPIFQVAYRWAVERGLGTTFGLSRPAS